MGDIIAFSDSFPDDRLRLIFTCAHPAIAPDIRTALALRTICGVAMDRLAAAFLMPTATLYQRLDWWRWTPSTRQVSRIIAAGSARAGIYWPKRARSNRPPKRWTAPWRWVRRPQDGPIWRRNLPKCSAQGRPADRTAAISLTRLAVVVGAMRGGAISPQGKVLAGRGTGFIGNCLMLS